MVSQYYIRNFPLLERTRRAIAFALFPGCYRFEYRVHPELLG